MPKVIAETHIKFMIVPRDLWHDKTLSLSAKAVYVDLLSYSNKTGECFPSKARIAKDLGISTKTVSRVLKELLAFGWIEIKSGKMNGSANRYFLKSEGYVKLSQGVGQNVLGVGLTVPGGRTPGPYEGIPIEGITNNKGQDPLGHSPKNHYNGEEKFNKWWDIYPRKVKKKDAKKIFMKLKPDDALLETMINAVKRQIKWHENELKANRFVPDWPHPTTWLNGERWEDEILEKEKSACPF